MRDCMQSQGISVLDHGKMVRRKYLELMDILIGQGPVPSGWVIPSWMHDNDLIRSVSRHDDRLVGLYQVYHDCGKPHCLVIDDSGRRHFPDHAAVSAATRLSHSDGSPEAVAVSELIGMDMDFHLLRPECVGTFAVRPQADILMVTALAELHANAEMFGGTGSVGFKIKYKRQARLGQRVMDVMEVLQ